VVDASGNPVAGKTTTIPLQRPAFSPEAIAAAQAQPLASAPVNAIVDPSASNLPMLPPPPGGSAAAVTTPVAATQTQAAAPAAATPTASTPAGSAPAYVQLASQRSEADARATANTIVSRFGPLFNGANIEIQRADLGERGIYYRVRVPAASLSDATAMCNNLKAQGGDCVPM